jgi:plastocyanin
MKGKSSILYFLIATVVVIGGIIWYTSQKGTIAPTIEESTKMNNNSANNLPANSSAEKEVSQKIMVIEVKGSPFKFEPNEIRVKSGAKVLINFISEKGMHDWVVDEFNARTKIIKDGETDSVEFTADKVGTFEYYCSVGNHRAMGMKGNLIVE